MPLSREKKEDLVTQYTEMLKNSRALIVTDFRGLNTAQMTKLRREIGEADANLIIIKNRLFELAMQEAGLDMPPDFLDGPVAAAFTRGDVPPVAKALTQFAKDSEILVVKGGLLEENFLSSSEIQSLAELPPLEVLRAQLLGLLSAPSTNIAGVMASSVRGVVSVLAAHVEQGGGAPESAPAASNGAAIDEAAPEAEVSEEAAPEAEASGEVVPEAEASDEVVSEAEVSEEAASEAGVPEEATGGDDA